MITTEQYPDFQALATAERIEYFKKELRLVTPPKTFRERVLVSVYQSLLAECRSQKKPCRP